MIGYIGLIVAMVFIFGGSVFIYAKKKKNMYFNKSY